MKFKCFRFKHIYKMKFLIFKLKLYVCVKFVKTFIKKIKYYSTQSKKQKFCVAVLNSKMHGCFEEYSELVFDYGLAMF